MTLDPRLAYILVFIRCRQVLTYSCTAVNFLMMSLVICFCFGVSLAIHIFFSYGITLLKVESSLRKFPSPLQVIRFLCCAGCLLIALSPSSSSTVSFNYFLLLLSPRPSSCCLGLTPSRLPFPSLAFFLLVSLFSFFPPSLAPSLPSRRLAHSISGSCLMLFFPIFFISYVSHIFGPPSLFLALPLSLPLSPSLKIAHYFKCFNLTRTQ